MFYENILPVCLWVVWEVVKPETMVKFSPHRSYQECFQTQQKDFVSKKTKALQTHSQQAGENNCV